MSHTKRGSYATECFCSYRFVLSPCFTAITLVSKYVTKGWKAVQEMYGELEKTDDVMKVFMYLEAVEKIKHTSDELEVAHLIEEHKLEREHLLTKHLKSREVGEQARTHTHTHPNRLIEVFSCLCVRVKVWKALLKEMSLSTLLTHLGKMSADKLLCSGSAETAAVCERIQDEHALLKAIIPKTLSLHHAACKSWRKRCKIELVSFLPG